MNLFSGNFTFENEDMQILLNQHAKHHDFQGVNLNFLKKILCAKYMFNTICLLNIVRALTTYIIFEKKR